ncbi:MAG: four helix bundle protein [Phycisphaerae bacterium]|nr:four helix bundle protein [Gemmatimonadaceae bacterium]
MADFRKLLVWQRAHEFNIRVSRVATGIRGAQYMSLRSQMARAAASIPANLVEGRRQKTDRQFATYVRISVNSSSELEYHLLTARDLGALSTREFDSLVAELEEIRRMLAGLLRTLESTAHYLAPKLEAGS